MFPEIFNATTATVGTIIGIVSGLFGIISYIIAERIKHDAQFKLQQYSSDLEDIYKMASSTIWEVEMVIGEYDQIRVRKYEQMKACLTNIRLTTAKYINRKSNYIGDNTFAQLIEQKIVWSNSNIFDVEQSDRTVEIWLVTPDLEPDLSDQDTGQVVHRNIKTGRQYIYFYPEDLEHAQYEINALRKNIGISNNDRRALFIALSRDRYRQISPSLGNMVLYYDDKERIKPPKCFEEILLTKVQKRGSVWQEHSEVRTKKLWHILEEEYNNWLSKNSQSQLIEADR